MNAGPDVERLIAAWLVEEAPGRAPDRVLASAGTVIDRTRQRRFLAAWREPMHMSMRGLAAAAAIGAVLVGGTIFALRTGPSDSVGGAPAPSVEPSPSPQLSPSPSPSQALVACDLVTTKEAESATAQLGLRPLPNVSGDETTCVYADGGGDVQLRITWLKVGGGAAFDAASATAGVEDVTDIEGIDAVFDPAFGKLYVAKSDALVTLTAGSSSEAPAMRRAKVTRLGQLVAERM